MNKADMIYDLSTVWAVVKEQFPYFERLGFDWDELYRVYLDKILATEDERGFHKLMTDFMDRLNDGHTRYIPPEAYRDAAPYVRPEAPSADFEDGVLTVKLNEFMRDHSAYVAEMLEAHENVSLVRLDVRDNIGGNTFYAAKVAELFISGSFSGCRKWTQIHNAVDAAGASQLNGYSEERIQKYIEDGLITKEAVVDDKRVLGRTKYKEYTDSFGREDNTAVYAGLLQILISGRTMSAAEDFVAMFRSNKRGVLVGEPTYGSTGTPYIMHLRCGGRAQVVSVGYRMLDGTEFIGVGIKPDISAQ